MNIPVGHTTGGGNRQVFITNEILGPGVFTNDADDIAVNLQLGNPPWCANLIFEKLIPIAARVLRTPTRVSVLSF